MKTSTILTTTSLAAWLSSFALLACGAAEVEPADQTQSAGLTQQKAPVAGAAEAERPAGRGEHHRGPGRGFGPPSAEKLLERFDANKDGQLQAAELPERMQEHIGDIDTSHDGIVSKDELDAHFKAKRAEFAAKFEERAKERFAKRDANHDGMLEQSEVPAEHWANLSAADANGDKKLTPEELKAAFEAGKLAPPQGGHRGHGRRGEHREHDDAAPPAVAPAPAATPAL